jgi:hypothetical protein
VSNGASRQFDTPVAKSSLELEVAYCVGGVISPLLCNVALHVLDAEWMRTSGSLGVLVRYADDLLVLCRSRARAEQARRRVAEILAGLGLALHPDKTRIVCLTRGQQGVDFLGFHLHKVESWKWRGRYYLQRWPSDRAMVAIRAKVREATDRRFVGYPVDWVVVRLNRVLRGWGAYFRSSQDGQGAGQYTLGPRQHPAGRRAAGSRGVPAEAGGGTPRCHQLASCEEVTRAPGCRAAGWPGPSRAGRRRSGRAGCRRRW